LAFEASRQLTARGFKVKGLVLIDTPSPIDHKPLPNEVISYVIKLNTHGADASNNDALRKEFQLSASMAAAYKPVPFCSQIKHSRLPTVMLKSQSVLDTERLCGVRYDWLSDQATRDSAIVDWEELVGGHVEVLPIPGTHFETFNRENVSFSLDISMNQVSSSWY
jgi:thioesterase domain-containing protein